MADFDPIIAETPFKKDPLNHLIKDLRHRYHDASKQQKREELIARFPTVYLFLNDKSKDNFKYHMYVGETNNIKQRTKQHFDDGNNSQNFWYEFARSDDTKLYVIGDPEFNKSLTMDIENTLISYIFSIKNVKLHNGRGNPQGEYYTYHDKDKIVSKIWLKLRKENNQVFPLEREIQNSAIFKASPFHTLTEEQELAKDQILNKIKTNLANNNEGSLILVEGKAGSGKTVLLSTLFYLINELNQSRVKDKKLKNYLLVNHDEQLKVYQEIALKLGIIDKTTSDIVSKPIHFINTMEKNHEKADITLIDEAHLLWTQGKQSYRGHNQLADILKHSKITIAIFDSHQILKTEEYIEASQLKAIEHKAIKNNNLIELHNQLRIHANLNTVKWIRNITNDQRTIGKIPHDDNYDLKIFDNAQAMFDAIKAKAQNTNHGLSRVLATFDWEYKSNKKPKNGKYWMVNAGNLSQPWNLQLPFDKSQRGRKHDLAWAEQKQTVNEIGSTYTIQGFDLNYCGVILGTSVQYRNGHIVFDASKSHNHNAIRNRTMSDGERKQVSDKLLPNELNVLLTRGVNGLYIYACDDELREKLSKENNNI